MGARALSSPQNAIVFIGASSIVRWNLKESFPELGAQAINRGFGGSLAADSTRYADLERRAETDPSAESCDPLNVQLLYARCHRAQADADSRASILA